ncbi:LamB/YcsF family protein [Leifsonella bigeumensis]|uniref:LamB/YcsF family protein n=1 Tax=Leifsonella bigeumensis TaxID=433643 RepID=UPI0031D7D072
MDLNSDLGEWDLPADAGDDVRMFGLVTSANIACGFHAGNAESMLASVRSAADNGVSLGAHPSYRDREGFGRRDQEVDAATLIADILEQVEALTHAADSAGDSADVRIRYLKPHGALYNRIAVDPVQADAVALAARDAGLPLLGLAGTAIHTAADGHGVQFFREAFVDRAYLSDGRLVPRAVAGAVLTDPAAVAVRAIRMVADGAVEAIDGTVIRVELDSLCVHGDTPGAFAMAAAVREHLTAAEVELRAFA